MLLKKIYIIFVIVFIILYQSDQFTCLSRSISIVNIILVIVFIILYQSDQFTCLSRCVLL